MQFALPEMAQPLPALLAAISAGLLIGLERGWSQRDKAAGTRVAGFRTFGLLGLVGGLGALLPDIAAGALALGAVLVIAVGYLRTAERNEVSATTAISGILTLAIGFAAVRISATVALACAAVTFALLSSRHSLHALLKGLTEDEIEGVARFLVVALVVLPLLPDRAMGPYEAWNPRQIWMVVVLVAALSFAGYLAARRFGSERGILATAFTGAIVSSTAVTAEYARRLAKEPEAKGPLAAGIAIASIVMFVRVQLLTLILAPRALPTLALTMAPATLVAALLAFAAWRRQRGEKAPPVTLGNPFDFGPALLLAGSVAVLSLIARWALDRFGDGGIAVVLGLTGLMDVDASVITLAGLPREMVADAAAGVILAVPVLANTAIKGGIAVLFGGRRGLAASLPLFASLAGLAAWRFWWS
jgi:uncharacterized membrane protein (DUF4010 family)